MDTSRRLKRALGGARLAEAYLSRADKLSYDNTDEEERDCINLCIHEAKRALSDALIALEP